jgi:peptide/nickel transport system permease protein
MEPLSWSGALGPILNPIMLAALVVFALGFVGNFILTLVGVRAGEVQINPDHTLTIDRTPVDYALMAMKYAALLFVACCAGYIIGGMLMPTMEAKGIIGAMASRLTPVWISLVVVFAGSIYFKRKLGLYGKLFDSPIGMVGFGLVMFWIFASAFAGVVSTHGPIDVISQMRNEVPGSPIPSVEDGEYAFYLLGGDNLGARRLQPHGLRCSTIVMQDGTPAATLFAFMVGITLGLPAGYFGGRLDTVAQSSSPTSIAGLPGDLAVLPAGHAGDRRRPACHSTWRWSCSYFPLVFFVVLFNSRYHTQPPKQDTYLAGGHRW